MRDDERIGLEALETAKVWAVVGASQDPKKYGHEVLAALRELGKEVLPVNPRYTEIDGQGCYPTLAALPKTPEVVVLALAPERTAAAVEAMPALDALVWLPSGCWSEEAVEACQAAGKRVVHNVCPVGLSRQLGTRLGR